MLELRTQKNNHQNKTCRSQNIEEQNHFDQLALSVLYSQAELFLKNKKLVQARNILSQILKKDPDNEESLLLFGDSFYLQQDYQAALTCYEKAANIEESFDALFKIAHCLYELDQVTDAINYYFLVLLKEEAEEESLFIVYKNLGNLFVRQRDFDQAKEFYDRAFQINKLSDILLVNYGILEIQKNHFEKASSFFRRALDINPDNDKAWAGLALIHRSYGDHELAWANAIRALDANISNQVSLQLIEQWAWIDQKFDSLITYLGKYLEKYDQDVRASLVLAKVLFQSKKKLYALAEVERVLSLDPKNEEALILLENYGGPTC